MRKVSMLLLCLSIGVFGSIASAQVQTMVFTGNADLGGDCYDTMVAHDQPITGGYKFWGSDSSYGGMDYIGANESAGMVSPEGQNTRTLLRFDVSVLAGQFESIESVELRLYQLEGVATNVTAFRVSDANSNWQEGPDQGSGVNYGAWFNRTSWNYKLRGLTDGSWAGGPGLSVAGVDYDAASVAVGTSNSGVGWMSLDITGDVTTMIEEWAQSPSTRTFGPNDSDLGIFTTPEEFAVSSNEGLLLMADEGVKWSSSEGTFSPELVVRYTAVPEPVTIFTMGCGAVALIRRRRK